MKKIVKKLISIVLTVLLIIACLSVRIVVVPTNTGESYTVCVNSRVWPPHQGDSVLCKTEGKYWSFASVNGVSDAGYVWLTYNSSTDGISTSEEAKNVYTVVFSFDIEGE